MFWKNVLLVLVGIIGLIIILSTLTLGGVVIVFLANHLPLWISIPLGVVAFIFLLAGLITWLEEVV